MPTYRIPRSCFTWLLLIAEMTSLIAVGTRPAAAQTGESGVGHDTNVVYQQLLRPGLRAPSGKVVPFPPPYLADNVDADQQQAILNELTRGASDRYLRESMVAPHVCKLNEIEEGAEGVVRGIDYWFIAYADLDAITSTDFLSGLEGDVASDEEKESLQESRALTEGDLAKRNITLAAPHAYSHGVSPEAYGQARFRLLNRVELSAVGRTYWTRTEHSAIVAFQVDDRFVTDREFPLQWSPLTRQTDGSLVTEAPQAYSGAGSYIKVTRLAEPERALFVEGHVVYWEPHGWFDGRNQLRAKIPAIVQNQVRTARREMVAASAKQATK
ncbi:MAG: hypothetical protein KDA60_17265 [Planctomycetales bacterium]|nr:hypothetical protein [Planctomycetales bacterium]